MFYNCLSTLGPIGPIGLIRPAEGSGTTEGDVID